MDYVPCVPTIDVLALCEDAMLGGEEDRGRIRGHSGNDHIWELIPVDVAYRHRPRVIADIKGAEGGEEAHVRSGLSVRLSARGHA